MDLDITNMRSLEIINILTNYPDGHLKIKNNRAIWFTEVDNQRLHPSAPIGGADWINPETQRQQKPEQDSNPLNRMQESLFRSVCG